MLWCPLPSSRVPFGGRRPLKNLWLRSGFARVYGHSRQAFSLSGSTAGRKKPLLLVPTAGSARNRGLPRRPWWADFAWACAFQLVTLADFVLCRCDLACSQERERTQRWPKPAGSSWKLPQVPWRKGGQKHIMELSVCCNVLWFPPLPTKQPWRGQRVLPPSSAPSPDQCLLCGFCLPAKPSFLPGSASSPESSSECFCSPPQKPFLRGPPAGNQQQ